MSAARNLSPEVDVMEQIAACHTPLSMVVATFRDVERAKRVLRFLVTEDGVEFVRTVIDQERALQKWEVRELIENLSDSCNGPADMELRLTDKGLQKWHTDSKAFIESLS
jgi:hypothetical protein